MGHGNHTYGQENGVQFVHTHSPRIQNLVKVTAGYGISHKMKNYRPGTIQ
jgi:hypothetical protein